MHASDQTKYVALSFDDGPTGSLTLRLLEELDARDVHATFFLCGSRIAQMPDVVQAIAAGGHELGIHCYNHALLGQASAAEIQDSIEQTAQLISIYTGQEPVLFRPPGGVYTEAMRQVCRDELLPLVLWSLDPKDWASHDASVIQSRVIRQIKSGDIVLLHDLRKSSVDAAIGIIDTLHAQGYTFITVSQLAELNGVTMQPGEIYTGFSNGSSTAASNRS